MKIMLQNHTFYPAWGGIENYLYYVSETLKEMGHQPIILCEKHDKELPSFDTYSEISIVRHPNYKIHKPLLFIKPRVVSEQLRHFIRNHVGGIDLIISRYLDYCYATCSLELDIPVFYVPATVHWKYTKTSSKNLTYKEKLFNSLWKPIFDHMEKKSIIMSDEVVTFSQHISNSLAQYHVFDPSKFIVNRPGVDLNRFKNSHCSSELRQEFNIPMNRVIVLYVGRISLEKNVERLIKEFSSIKRKNIHLLIVGDGQERLRLEELTKELRMNGGVTFVGSRTDVERFYAAADIFVLPSKYEAFGQVILEAMSAALPCIAFKKVLPEYEVACEEIIRDGITGFCVDPYNKNEFGEKLVYLIENPDIRIRMGGVGREVCQKEFTWEGHVTRLLDLVKLTS